MTDLKDYTLIEELHDVTSIENTIILSCANCRLAPSFRTYVENSLPPSLSRRFTIYCPRCSKHPLSMFTLEGMIEYWNRVRK